MELSLDLNKRYSYADYLTWMDDVRRELFDGFIKLMSPAPVRSHQRIAGELHGNFWSYLRQKPCQVYQAPFDVRLPKNGERANKELYTVVQPDICVICDKSKLDERGCLGAPDLIVEIISPSSSKIDVKDKYEIYERAGVREYWIVFPFEKVISVFLLNENGKYEAKGMFTSGDLLSVSVFNDNLKIDLTEIFACLDEV
jgi:Uma2 family endonuclease